MARGDFPAVGPLLEAGADDRVFDGFLLLGPIVIIVIVILGRTFASMVLALTYIGIFLGYLLYKGLANARYVA